MSSACAAGVADQQQQQLGEGILGDLFRSTKASRHGSSQRSLSDFRNEIYELEDTSFEWVAGRFLREFREQLEKEGKEFYLDHYPFESPEQFGLIALSNSDGGGGRMQMNIDSKRLDRVMSLVTQDRASNLLIEKSLRPKLAGSINRVIKTNKEREKKDTRKNKKESMPLS
eukprot:TRINITY_DN4849_c1_g1_i5.p1 TRINITY_DN4849_c1_g1~~TRINITY_DN4849_c1_g1_i5.p1  ORF type:complete len:180 (+),score=17.79 TRINITY_DN4849_c1_g1_i5:29-541(+)